MPLVAYDITSEVLAIAARLADGGRLISRYSSPAWTAELTTAEGTIEGSGATASQAIIALGRKLSEGRE
jgi:hypothetical protein